LAFTVPRRFGGIIAGDSRDKTAFSRQLINREIAIDSGLQAPLRPATPHLARARTRKQGRGRTMVDRRLQQCL